MKRKENALREIQEESNYEIKRGLRRKMFTLCAAMILVACVAFGVIGIVQLRGMQKLASDTNEAQNEAIKGISEETLTEITFENMINTVYESAKNTDYRFWKMKHDFLMLADQVRDVFEHPDKYEEREVSPPSSVNAGKPVLQMVYSDPALAEDEETMIIVRKLANLEPMMREITLGNEGYTRDCYISLPNGATLEMDAFSDRKLDDRGVPNLYDPTTRPWYQVALEKGEFAFTLAVHSYYMGSTQVQYGVPIYVNGELKAVLQGSTMLTRIHDILSEVSVSDKGFSIMISDNGQLVYSPRETGELMMPEDMSIDFRTKSNDSLRTLITEALTNFLGVGEADIDGEHYFAAYAAMSTSGWSQIIFVPESEMDAPTNRLLEEMDAIGEETDKQFRSASRQANLLILIVILILIANAFLAAMIFSGKVMNPINKMTGRLKDVSGDAFVFEMDDAYKTGDEIEVLANTFGRLSDKMQEYLKNILTMTAEKERVGTELSIASQIQTDMLPEVSGIFAETKEFLLSASMTPAKEVGGDFYDFFMINDDHLCLVIADVSGKGVPAALFMMASKIIIEDHAKIGKSPAQVLHDTNKALCAKGQSDMFVTIWIGVLEISTGKLTAADGGHEYPVILKHDGVELYKEHHGIFVGGIEGIDFTDYEIQLNPGDKVFVYTDGVPGAMNSDKCTFGLERMCSTLGDSKNGTPEEILKHMEKTVDSFAGDAEQFDDLTMLCLEYKGSGS